MSTRLWSAVYGLILGVADALRLVFVVSTAIGAVCFFIMGFCLIVGWSLTLGLTGWAEYIQPGMPIRYYRPAPFRLGPVAYRPWHVVVFLTCAALWIWPQLPHSVLGWIQLHHRWVGVTFGGLAAGILFGLLSEIYYDLETRRTDIRRRFERYFQRRMRP